MPIVRVTTTATSPPTRDDDDVFDTVAIDRTDDDGGGAVVGHQRRREPGDVEEAAVATATAAAATGGTGSDDDDDGACSSSLPPAAPVHKSYSRLWKNGECCRRRRDSSKSRRTGPMIVVGTILLLSLVALIIGLSVGLTREEKRNADIATPNDNNNDGGGDDDVAPTTTAASALEQVREWLIAQGISSESELRAEGTYQYRAALWMATGRNAREEEGAAPEGNEGDEAEDPEETEIAQAANTSPTTPIPKTSNYQPNVSNDAYRYVTRYVLACLYYATTAATDGPEESTGSRYSGWAKSLNFLSNASTCEWSDRGFLGDTIGVGCGTVEGDEELTGQPNLIKLEFNGLRGQLPSELAKLWSVRVLDFEGNALTGTIPTEFADMPLLRTLILGRNSLSGTIPSGLGKNGLFRSLVLSNNGNITGPIPSSLSSSSSTLQALSVDDNQLTGDVNFLSQFANLTLAFLEDNNFTGTLGSDFMASANRLQILDLSDNAMEGGLPSHLFALPGLETLDLHGNAFSSLPESFPEKSALTFLALHENAILGPVPASIANLDRLRHLDLSRNRLTGELPASNVPTSVTYLFLAENDFEKGPIPQEYASLTNLRELSLKGTSRNGTIPYFFASSTSERLVLLDLDDNHLTGRIPEFGRNGTAPNLYGLLLNRNELTGPIPSSLQHLDNLQLLFLDGNANLSGSLAPICDTLPQFFANASNSGRQPAHLIADCEAISCRCCTLCCLATKVDGGGDDAEACHGNDRVASIDPTWEGGYNRPDFVFGNDTVLQPAYL